MNLYGNGSKEVSIIFQASDKYKNVTYTLSKNDTVIESGNATTKLAIPNYIFNTTILLTNESTYGVYTFTAFTNDPEGTASLNISAVFEIPNNGKGVNGISVEVIAAICAAAAGVLILIVILIMIRRKHKKSDSLQSSQSGQTLSSGNHEKEEKINPIYGSSVCNEKEERANPLYGTSSAEVSDATYTSVIKPNKVKMGNLEKEEKANPLYNPVTSNDNVVEEAYAAVDKRKKRGGNENPVFTVDSSGDTYTAVLKNKKKKNVPTEPNVMYAEVQKKDKKKKAGVDDSLHGS